MSIRSSVSRPLTAGQLPTTTMATSAARAAPAAAATPSTRGSQLAITRRPVATCSSAAAPSPRGSSRNASWTTHPPGRSRSLTSAPPRRRVRYRRLDTARSVRMPPPQSNTSNASGAPPSPSAIRSHPSWHRTSTPFPSRSRIRAPA